MGQIEIIDREWIRDTVFWFELDGAVIFDTREIGSSSYSEKIKSKYWQIRKVRGDAELWFVVDSNESKTKNRDGSFGIGNGETPKEVFCKFTSQISRYEKPISHSPHNERLKWTVEEQ